VSLLVNAFELGMAELAEELGMNNLGDEAYKYTQDINQYITNKSGTQKKPQYCTDIEAVERIKTELCCTLNFRSRKVCSEAKRSSGL